MGILVAVLLVLGTSTQGARSSAAAQIHSARERSNRAIAKHDIQTFAESLAPDFVMVRGNGALVPSREAYIELFRQGFLDPKELVYERTADRIEVSSAAPLAAEHGHWVGRNPNGTIGYRGTYLAMWRHTENGWKLRSELFVLLACGEGEACKDYAKSAESPTKK